MKSGYVAHVDTRSGKTGELACFRLATAAVSVLTRLRTHRARAHKLTMSLEPGITLGPYSVTAKIGEGGMGGGVSSRDTKTGTWR